MKEVYPIVMTQGEKYVVVYVPDFDINTQGTDYADAMEMARDAIGVIGIDMEDDHEALPTPSDLGEVVGAHPDATVTLVDVDFTEYRRMNDMKTVRRNVSLPNWLNARAERAGLNVSAILQNALKAELHL